MAGTYRQYDFTGTSAEMQIAAKAIRFEQAFGTAATWKDSTQPSTHSMDEMRRLSKLVDAFFHLPHTSDQ